MRTGVADLHRRGQVSQATNERLLDALARTDDSRTVEELTASIQQPMQFLTVYTAVRIIERFLCAVKILTLMSCTHF